MLTANRQALADRAVRCYLSQTYEPRQLLIWDTGSTPYQLPDIPPDNGRRITLVHCEHTPPLKIGQLRNQALGFGRGGEIICHWDDDDWSAPERIADQVRLLTESGCDAVGYREMVFWRSPREVRAASDMSAAALESGASSELLPGEAWLYRNTDPKYIISTSLCYWRKTWERVPFADTQVREWKPWFDGGVQTFGALDQTLGGGPKMIAEIHGGNTCAHTALDPRGVNRDGSLAWTRVPEWDERVRQILEAA